MSDTAGARLVILDRDGVINEDSDDYIKSVSEWVPVPGSLEAIARLSRAGYRVAVATNQSGLGRGLFTRDTLDAMHAHMLDRVAAAGGRIDALCLCPHHPDEDCDCRKPRPGLVRQIEKQLDTSAVGAYFVGDSQKDLELARTTGCIPLLVRTGKGPRTLAAGGAALAAGVFDDLSTAVDYILARADGTPGSRSE